MIPLMTCPILILFFLLSSINSINISNASDIIKSLRKVKANEKLLKLAINNTLEFLKHHIYYTVSYAPPKPKKGGSYFPKIDYSQIFNNINTSNTNYFDFKNEFISAIRSLNDIHTVAYFNQIPLENYVYICPIVLEAEYDQKEKRPKMFGKLSIPENNYNLFKNGDEVAEIIKKNADVEIKSIKGKDPFTFIKEFAGIKLKNRHSTYVHNQQIYSRNTFQIPATFDDLTNFTVEYVNNDTFTTEYIVQDISQKNNDIKYYENDEVNNNFLQYLYDYYNNTNSLDTQELFTSFGAFKNFNDLILDFERLNKNKIKSRNLFFEANNPNYKQTEEIIWDYNYTSIENINNIVFQCRVDPKNKVNVVKINSFGGLNDSEPSLSVAEKCAYLFDENEYKIIIIVPQNWGGNPIIGYNIIELLSPYILTRNTIRIKKDENFEKLIEVYTKHFNPFHELNSTKEITTDYFKDGFISEIYGDIMTKTEQFSKPFTWRINQKKIEQIKSKLKHKRTPTDIIVLTDGLALSAASIFLKNIYKSGAGIIIGYNSYPYLSNDIFDISQSPSLVLNVNGYKDIYPEIAKKTGQYGIGLYSLTCMATYHEYQESHTPQEYDVQQPDTIINIYKPYSDLYYQEFIDESKKVLKSYKDSCNPNNEMLVLFSNECEFLNKRLHGGYPCGKDSKWDKSICIPVYCDTGYYFNKISKSCIKYPIEGTEIVITPEKKFELWMILTIAGGAFIILATTITIIILFVKKALCFKKCDKNKTPDCDEVNDDLLID